VSHHTACGCTRPECEQEVAELRYQLSFVRDLNRDMQDRMLQAAAADTSEIVRLRAAVRDLAESLGVAYEWAAGFPLAGTGSGADHLEATHIYGHAEVVLTKHHDVIQRVKEGP
jgi:hypothetical protein